VLGISNSLCAIFIKILAKELALASFLLCPYSQVFKEAIASFGCFGFLFPLNVIPLWRWGVIYACKQNKLHFYPLDRVCYAARMLYVVGIYLIIEALQVFSDLNARRCFHS